MIRSMLLLSAVCCLLSSSASVASAQMPSVMPGTGPIKPRPATIRDTSSDDQQSQSDKEWKLGLTLVEGGKGVPCKVVEVFSDSPAARIGFRKGDVLISINGDIADDPLNVRNTIFAEDSVSLVYRRGAVHYQTDVVFDSETESDSNDGSLQQSSKRPVPVKKTIRSTKTKRLPPR